MRSEPFVVGGFEQTVFRGAHTFLRGSSRIGLVAVKAGVNVDSERIGGIIFGMISPENGQQILDSLGSEFQDALIDSVGQARVDLHDFKNFRPSWFPSFTQRFVSNFIHERVWAELVRRIDADPSSTIIDEEPLREIGWMNRFKLRVKRHKAGDVIAAFPTDSAKRWYNPSLPLDGLEITNLAVGYKWEDDRIGPAVISYRESVDSRALWAVTLDRSADSRSIEFEDVYEDTMPELDLSGLVAIDEEEDTGTN